MDIWQKYHILFWVLIGIAIFFLVLIIIYLILKFGFKRKLSGIGLYLTYYLLYPLMFIVEIIRFPKRRKAWLIKIGLKEGQSYLEEGFGMGTSPILASKIVGKNGVVYALDNHPINIAILYIRSKIRKIKNIEIIFSDAKDTGLEDKSIDTIFICDAFHEFTDKKNTAIELYRVLKPGGYLSIWDENVKYTNNAQKIVEATKLFKLIEREKSYVKFKKEK